MIFPVKNLVSHITLKLGEILIFSNLCQSFFRQPQLHRNEIKMFALLWAASAGNVSFGASSISADSTLANKDWVPDISSDSQNLYISGEEVRLIVNKIANDANDLDCGVLDTATDLLNVLDRVSTEHTQLTPTSRTQPMFTSMAGGERLCKRVTHYRCSSPYSERFGTNRFKHIVSDRFIQLKVRCLYYASNRANGRYCRDRCRRSVHSNRFCFDQSSCAHVANATDAGGLDHRIFWEMRLCRFLQPVTTIARIGISARKPLSLSER